MNVLLATYSYYPYNYGGTEVYVSGLASFLKEQGSDVTIIAGMPPKAFEDHPVFYEDDQLKTVEYFFNSTRVIGVIMKAVTTTEIYNKFRPQWVDSWGLVLSKMSNIKFDILHMQSNTSGIGYALVKAVKLHSENVKTIASYHVPVSCVKGTLMFGNKMETCKVAPAVDICSACYISSERNISLRLTKKLVPFIPVLKTEQLPTAARIKYLVSQFISAFISFDKEINQWHVFSEQIRTILLLNAVPGEKISLLRHGVDLDLFHRPTKDALHSNAADHRVFFYVGRFAKAKGFITMMNAWCSLPETTTKELWLVGKPLFNDDEAAECIRASSERKDIKWFGSRSQEGVAELMKQVHCTIIPSECLEIGPLVFHEAIAAGADVIASDIGGCAELAAIYTKKSTLFETGNSKSLAQRILNFKFSKLNETPNSQLHNYLQVFESYNHLLAR